MAVLWLEQAKNNTRLAGQEKLLSSEGSGSVPLEGTPGKVVGRRTELLKGYEMNLNEPKVTENCIRLYACFNACEGHKQPKHRSLLQDGLYTSR